MTRAELVRRVRDRGLPALPHHVETAATKFMLDPPPVLDAGHRRVYREEHVEQLAGYVANVVSNRDGRTKAAV